MTALYSVEQCHWIIDLYFFTGHNSCIIIESAQEERGGAVANVAGGPVSQPDKLMEIQMDLLRKFNSFTYCNTIILRPWCD